MRSPSPSFLSLSLFIIFIILSLSLSLSIPSFSSAPSTATSSSSSSSPPLRGLHGRILSLPRSSLSTIRIFIDGNHVGGCDSQGKFHFPSVPSGKHSMEIFHSQYIFTPLVVEIEGEGEEKTLVSSRTIHSKAPLSVSSLSISPHSPSIHFIPREPFNVWGLFKNPMIIMMGITGLMIFVFPKMMANMDPKELEEMQKMQSQMSISGMMKNIQNPGGATTTTVAEKKKK